MKNCISSIIIFYIFFTYMHFKYNLINDKYWRFHDFGKPQSFTKYLRQTLGDFC